MGIKSAGQILTVMLCCDQNYTQLKVVTVMTDITKTIAIPTDRFDVFNQLAINCGRTIKRFIRTLTTLSKKTERIHYRREYRRSRSKGNLLLA